MNVTVTQIDHPNASTGVDIYVQGVKLGQIGRGGSVSTEIPYTDQCEVVAECGSYKKRMVVGGDADILVKWVLNPPDLVMERRRSPA